MAGFRVMPTRIRRICMAQFFAWLAWFPFLFYATTWISEIQLLQMAKTSPAPILSAQLDARAGSLAFFLFSLVSLAGSIFIPRLTQADILGLSLTLTDVYTASHVLFACAMMLTIVAQDSTMLATILLALCGLSWAVMMWAPFALIGETLSRMADYGTEYVHLTAATMNEDAFADDDDIASIFGSEGAVGDGQSSAATDAGVVLGIHNVFVVLPQFVILAVSSIVFRVLEQGGGDRHDPNVIGTVLRIGALGAVAAAALSRRI